MVPKFLPYSLLLQVQLGAIIILFPEKADMPKVDINYLSIVYLNLNISISIGFELYVPVHHCCMYILLIIKSSS